MADAEAPPFSFRVALSKGIELHTQQRILMPLYLVVGASWELSISSLVQTNYEKHREQEAMTTAAATIACKSLPCMDFVLPEQESVSSTLVEDAG